MVSETKPIFCPRSERSLPEYVFALVGQIDGKACTTFKEVQDSFDHIVFEDLGPIEVKKATGLFWQITFLETMTAPIPIWKSRCFI